MPITVICICFVIGLIIKNRVYKKRLIVTGTVLLLFFSNDFIINEMMLLWEIPPTPLYQVPSDYDVAILLTGVTMSEKGPHDRVYFNKGADRVMHTVQLYKQQKIKKILITGGSGNLLNDEIKEADDIKRVLLLCDIPENDIVTENLSKNTRENAAFSAVILKEKFAGGKYLLITSAYHLRRAQGCFRKEGILADSFSTDFNTFPRKWTPKYLIIPTEMALHKWSILIREIIGMLFYKIAGYI